MLKTISIPEEMADNPEINRNVADYNIFLGFTALNGVGALLNDNIFGRAINVIATITSTAAVYYHKAEINRLIEANQQQTAQQSDIVI